MAVIAPQTDIYLLKVPLEINDINQLTFEDSQAQYNYFNSLPKIQAGDYSYQRKDGIIRYGGNFDEILNYNYVMYRNDAYSNKWFYAYITDIEYRSDNSAYISIKTDCWQTWQFDITFRPSLIDREHTNDDTVGANTLPESVELGEIITNGEVTNFGGGSDYCTVVEVTQIENTGENATLTKEWASGTHDETPLLNGIDRGTIPLIVGFLSGTGNTASYVTHLYDLAGLGGSIVNVYMLPKSLVGSYNELSLTATRGSSSDTIRVVVPETTFNTYNLGTSTFNRPSSLNNFTPKNNKLLTYPYCYFNISNNAGSSLPYHYEDFSSNIEFKVEGTFGLSGSTKAIPINYKYINSSENALDYSISGAKFPVCSWNSDSYTNWLTQNAVNIATEWKTAALATGIGAAGGAIRGGMAGGLIGGMVGAGVGLIENGGTLISTAREQMLARTTANLVPDQVRGNLNAGDFVWAKYRSPFTYTPMCIKTEYARCIDEYFSQFGYKCNRVKTPNITGRRTWNYVKTVGCYIEGNIPQSDMQEIKDIFDRGITLWHNPVQFGNYGADNDII